MAVVVTNTGLGIITNRLKGSGTEPKWVGIGTSTTTAAVGDTALGAEVESRADGTSTREQTVVANDTYQVVGTITATQNRAVAEAGLFDASSNGNMFLSADFGVINLGVNDSLQITAKVVFADGS